VPKGFRRRLAVLMGARVRPDEYPSWNGRLSNLMGSLIVWTGEHREYGDLWLSRLAWTARFAMLGLPAIFVAFVLSGGGR
jgi:hypothetical protein